MASLRAAIGGRLTPRTTNRLRSVVRAVEELAGWPLSPFRRGSVCMYHVARCGSSVVGGLLAQHPAIRWDREIYFHHFTAGDRKFRPWDSEAFLRRRMRAAGRRYYGFEVKFLAGQHLKIIGSSLPEYIAELDRAEVTHHVVLERRNGLRRMVSHYRGLQSSRRHVAVGEEVPETPRVRLDVDRMRFWRHEPWKSLPECLDEIASGYTELRSLLQGRPVLDLSFEDDVAEDPHAAYSRICSFLGLAPARADVHTRRLHARPLGELIENLDDVRAALRGTPHEWMLDD